MIPKTHRRVVLVRRPPGAPAESDFRVEETPVPEPGPREVLVRVVYLSRDPYQRGLVKHDEEAIAWLKQSYLVNAAEFIRVGREEEQIAFGHEIPNVLLLHATEFTTLMLPSLMHLLKQEGFRFAPLPKVERNPAYALDTTMELPDGGTLTEEVLTARHLKSPSVSPEPVEQLDSVCR